MTSIIVTSVVWLMVYFVAKVMKSYDNIEALQGIPSEVFEPSKEEMNEHLFDEGYWKSREEQRRSRTEYFEDKNSNILQSIGCPNSGIDATGFIKAVKYLGRDIVILDDEGNEVARV